MVCHMASSCNWNPCCRCPGPGPLPTPSRAGWGWSCTWICSPSPADASTCFPRRTTSPLTSSLWSCSKMGAGGRGQAPLDSHFLPSSLLENEPYHLPPYTHPPPSLLPSSVRHLPLPQTHPFSGVPIPFCAVPSLFTIVPQCPFVGD